MPEPAVTSDFEPQADNIEYRWYSRAGEWYLTACFTYLLIEGVFYLYLEGLIRAQEYFFKLTPYVPSILYFYGIGLFIGLLIILIGRREQHVPIRGIKAYLALWFVYVGWGLYGMLRGNGWWQYDIRNTILPSIVVPWAVVLAQNVRYNVVLSRIIKISIPFAVLNFIAGTLFYVRGAYVEEGSIVAATWMGECVLLLPYVLAFARAIGGGRAANLSLVILAMGILAPLHKPVIAMFLMANILLIYLGARNRLKVGEVRIAKAILAIFILVIVCAGLWSFLSRVSEGESQRYLAKRVFKRSGASVTELTGGRLDMWDECLARWKTNPVMGTGLGERLVRTWKGLTIPVPIHSLLVQTLMQTGLIGFTIAAIAIISWLRRSLKTLVWETDPVRVWTRLGLVTYICAILFYTLYGEALTIKSIAFTFWIALAMETAAHSQLIHWSLQGQSEYAPTTIMTDASFEQGAF